MYQPLATFCCMPCSLLIMLLHNPKKQFTHESPHKQYENESTQLNTHTPADWIRNGLESVEIHNLPEMLTHNSTPSCVTKWEED